MLNTRLEVARSVALPLIEMEKRLDALFADHAKVMTAAIEGRRRARLPLHAGQEGLERMADAMAGLLEVRKAIHDAHLIFRAEQDKMGLGPISYGDYGDTPRDPEPEGERHRGAGGLSVVAAA